MKRDFILLLACWLFSWSMYAQCTTATSPPYSTNFSTFLPTCWEEADAGNPTSGPASLGSGAWTQSGSSARINLWSTGKSDWLLSPEFDLSAPGPWELVINVSAIDYLSSVFTGMDIDDTVQVVISTDGGATWNPIYTWDQSNPPTLFPDNYIIDLTAYTGASNLFGIWASEGTSSGTNDFYFDVNNFEIRIPPSCDAPTSLMVSNITPTSADFSWMYSGSAIAPTWEVTYGAPGAPAGSGISALATGTTYSATNLMSNSPYDLYVRTICAPGDTSPWTGPVAFTTLCGTYTPTYSTDFSTFLPTCWEEADAGNPASGPTSLGSGAWARSGSSARINLWSTGKSDWLLSPEFDLSTPGSWELVLNVNAIDYPTDPFTSMDADDTVQVVISTDGGATWTPLYTWDQNNPPTGVATNYIIDLTGYTGTSNLFGIWASEGATSGTPDYYFILNNFEIRMPPSCAAPTSLMASNITPTSADLGWMYMGPAALWEVTYGAPGTPAGSGMSATSTTNPYNATGLMSNTTYEYYVRTICGPGDTSNWTGPFTFTTPCINLPGDVPEDAIDISALPYNTTGKTDSCYSDTRGSSSADVYYRLVIPACTDSLTISLCGSSYDTYLRVYASDTTTQLDVNDDACGTQSEIVIDVANDPAYAFGDTIYILVEGYTSNEGDYTLNITNTVMCPASSDLVITEIMYNPPESGTDSLEFVEIQNTGLTPVDLNGISFSNGVTYTFPATLLAPNAYYVVAVNATAFNNVYGVVADGEFGGGLANGGELLKLVNPLGATIDSVNFDDAGVWPSGFAQGEPDGGGASIELCDASTDNADGANWSASSTSVGMMINGFNILATPGAANNCPSPVDVAVDTIFLDEVYCKVSNVGGSFVVTNNSSAAVNGVTYTVTLNQLIIGTGTIPTLGANASDTIAVGPVPVTVGSGVVEVIVSATGDVDPNNDVMSKTVYISNIDAAVMATATISCNGDSTGALMASTADAYGMSMYMWNTGAMTAAVSNLPAGTYMVTATDSIGCSDTAMITLTEPLPIVITGNPVDVLCNGDSTGSITVSAAGGTGAFTYLWSNGATSASIANLPAATYTVTVTDANGCMAMQSYAVNEPTALSLNITHNNMDSATANVSGGTAPYTYNWSNSGTTATVGNLMTNTTYMVTVADANGCTIMDSVNIAFINVSTVSAVNNLSMFPNPAADQVFVDLDLATIAPVQIHITNAVGQLVSTQVLGNIQTQRVELSTKDLPDGLYLVQFQIGEEQVTQKLIVSRP